MSIISQFKKKFILILNPFCPHLSYLGYSLDIVKSKISAGASLVAQWLRIRLPVQGTQVQALVREDPTCRVTTKPGHHNY